MADQEPERDTGSAPNDHPQRMTWLHAWSHTLFTIFCWGVVVAAFACAGAYKVTQGYGEEFWTQHYYGIVGSALITSTIATLTGSVLDLIDPERRTSFMVPLKVILSVGPVLLVTTLMTRLPSQK